PEIVKNEPYGEKADVWAVGCILYQMVTLTPPFFSANMLSLATKIVEAVYEPVGDKTFSERVTDMIKWCLTPNADVRPDIIEVSSRISDIMMKFVDNLCASYNSLERRAERDRKRAQKYFLESNRTRMCRPLQQVQKQKRFLTLHPEYSLNFLKISGYFFGFTCVSHTFTASAGICLSQRKVRQIDDPNQRLLELLHKIIFITQLPPAPQNSFKQRAVERFKKPLFTYGSDPYNLKVELNKVLLFNATTIIFGLSSCTITDTKRHGSSIMQKQQFQLQYQPFVEMRCLQSTTIHLFHEQKCTIMACY
uniref:Protein kinase domain-containing protein n=1 Tax=Sinocyclocheilus rhinocerous TaxID=307959 RepID=A0A673HDY0_9TELE